MEGREGEINSAVSLELCFRGHSLGCSQVPGQSGAHPCWPGFVPGCSGGGWDSTRCSQSHPEPRIPSQEYRAVEQEMQQQMSLGELCYPEPLSFEPVKSFFKGLVDAMQSMVQTPLDVRLKESKLPRDQPCVLNSSSTL